MNNLRSVWRRDVTKLLGAVPAIPALTVPSVLFSQPERRPSPACSQMYGLIILPPPPRTLPEGTDPGGYAGCYASDKAGVTATSRVSVASHLRLLASGAPTSIVLLGPARDGCSTGGMLWFRRP